MKHGTSILALYLYWVRIPLGYRCMCVLVVSKIFQKKKYIYMVRETGGSEDDGKKILFLDRLEHLFLFYFGFNFEHFFYLLFWILVCTLKMYFYYP
jgi:hypothetical protein